MFFPLLEASLSLVIKNSVSAQNNNIYQWEEFI